MLCLLSITFSCYDSNFNKYKLNSKGLNERTLEDCDDGPLTKYRTVLDEFINITSTNSGFRSLHHSVPPYEQTRKGLFFFFPKRIVDADGFHTRPSNLQATLLCIVILFTSKCKAIVSIYKTCHSFELLTR